MAGSSPATCSAIGSAGIPEMRKRGYSGGFAAGIIAAGGTLGILLPPSITMILYAVAPSSRSAGCSWPAIGPALLLVALFADLRDVEVPSGIRCRQSPFERTGQQSDLLRDDTLTCATSSRCCRVCCRSSSC
jgi:TRAP-type mannitol/chloroaromatic compound transport system permease large subunit